MKFTKIEYFIESKIELQWYETERRSNDLITRTWAWFVRIESKSFINCFKFQVLQCVIYESAKLRALRAHLQTCLAFLRVTSHAHVRCLACFCVHVPTFLACLRAHMPTCLACFHANVSTFLACSRANAPTCLACFAWLRAHVL